MSCFACDEEIPYNTFCYVFKPHDPLPGFENGVPFCSTCYEGGKRPARRDKHTVDIRQYDDPNGHRYRVVKTKVVAEQGA